MKKIIFGTVLFALSHVAHAAISSATYLMSFHTCSLATTDCSNPTNHYTYIVQSNDGASWTLLPGFSTTQGSVPDLIRRGSRLYIYTPGKVARYNMDTNTWEPATNISIKHADGSKENFVDPSPIFDENGSIVLFYLASGASGDPAKCATNETSCVKVFRSATEVPGSDGTQFTVDTGNRAEITVDATGSRNAASDPDIFAGPTGYVLYISRGQGVQALSSSTLKGTYRNIAGLNNGILTESSGGIPAGHYDPATARFWTYVTTTQTSGTQVVRRAVTTSLGSAIAENRFSTVVAGAAVVGMPVTPVVASPGFVVNEAGPTPATVSGTSTGSNSNLTVSATVTVATKDIGKAGSFYVAALYKSTWYANNGTGWSPWTSGALPSFATTSAFESSRKLTILQNADVVGLSGAQIFAGYGTSLEDMLNNFKYNMVFSVP